MPQTFSRWTFTRGMLSANGWAARSIATLLEHYDAEIQDRPAQVLDLAGTGVDMVYGRSPWISPLFSGDRR
jgi:hypothetical protein